MTGSFAARLGHQVSLYLFLYTSTTFLDSIHRLLWNIPLVNWLLMYEFAGPREVEWSAFGGLSCWTPWCNMWCVLQEPFVPECDLTWLKGSRDIQSGMLVDSLASQLLVLLHDSGFLVTLLCQGFYWSSFLKSENICRWRSC